jgi:hypothetical protein
MALAQQGAHYRDAWNDFIEDVLVEVDTAVRRERSGPASKWWDGDGRSLVRSAIWLVLDRRAAS